ncbi:hypothetical protein PAXRUDRAFT_147593 [Paxillus rubicundulus Ve08.2h10]|uniref:Uncharacterized protein n=1 Tax=Paxillus rubicundulus Ve08.2h10 TaxID=930991 RepID=A0A0D0E4R9_9AGAM|nr:hypothetical protein PAXRUDRAFT_147593 [Paxillus rubicundulus Ve08.2h10]
MQETVLIEWIKFLGLIGHPISKETIGPYVFDLCGKHPSTRWVLCFLHHHWDLGLS